MSDFTANPSSTVANDPTSSDPASPTPPGTNDSSSFSVYILVSAIVSPIITVITCIAFGLFAYFVMKKRYTPVYVRIQQPFRLFDAMILIYTKVVKFS